MDSLTAGPFTTMGTSLPLPFTLTRELTLTAWLMHPAALRLALTCRSTRSGSWSALRAWATGTTLAPRSALAARTTFSLPTGASMTALCRRCIRRRFTLNFAGLPDANLRPVLEPVSAVHRHHLANLQTALDIGPRLIRLQHLDRAEMSRLIVVDRIDERPLLSILNGNRGY